MKIPHLQRPTKALLAVVVPLAALFLYVAVRSGPLAPVAVSVVRVESQAVAPAVFGTGTVEARYVYKIGPVAAGRLQRLDAQVGDRVRPGQVLGEMDPVDLEERLRSQAALLDRAQAVLREAEARQSHAASQAVRYEQLFAVRTVSEEALHAKQQELRIAEAALSAAKADLARSRADGQALAALRANLRLLAPVEGVVTARHADPGTTIVAGQPVVEVIDPRTLWVNVRLDQLSASGLREGLPARVELRSRAGQAVHGRVLRLEPKADAVTEEALAKVVFDALPQPLPPMGELAEVTVLLPPAPPAPVVPNSALRREGGRTGVWRVVDGELRFTPVTLGASDLDGHVQVRSGLQAGDRVVTHSASALTARSRIHVVDRIAQARP